MSRLLACSLVSALTLGGCYAGHNVELDAQVSEDAATADAMTEDAGTDAQTDVCVASECPATGFGAACCTPAGTCGLDANALGLGCIDTSGFGGGAAGAGGLPPGFFGGGAAGTGGTPD